MNTQGVDAVAGASPSAPLPRLFSPHLRGLTIGIVMLEALYAFEALGVVTAMPTVAEALDGLSMYAMAFGITLATSIVGLVAGGRWADRPGLAPLLTRGIALFALGLLISGSALSMPVFLVGRGLQGLGGGMLSVALYVAVARAYPAALHARMFAMFSAAWVVPAIVGPGLSGLLVEHAHWRLIFLGVAMLTLLCAPWVVLPIRRLPPTSPSTAAPQAPARIGWGLAAAAGLLLLHQSGQPGSALAWLLPCLGVGILVITCRRLLPIGTLGMAPGLPSVIAMRGLASAAFFGTEVFLPLLLSRERGLSPALAGVALTLGAAGWFIGSWMRSRLESPSPVRIIRAGMGMLAVGIAISALSLVPGFPVSVAVSGWMLAGLGMGLVRPTLAVLTLSLSTPGEQGDNAAALQLFDAMFTACVLALSGGILNHLINTNAGIGHALGFGISVALAVLGAVLASRVDAPGHGR